MVVAQTDKFVTAVDTAGIRDESDGSVSAIVAMFYVDPITTDKDGTQWTVMTGRVAFKCHDEQIKTLIVYAVSKDGKVKPVIGRDTTYIEVVAGSPLDAAGKYVCNAQHSVVTQERK